MEIFPIYNNIILQDYIDKQRVYLQCIHHHVRNKKALSFIRYSTLGFGISTIITLSIIHHNNVVRVHVREGN